MTRYIIKYERKTPAERSIEKDQEATKIRHKNESEQSGYVVMKEDKAQGFLETCKRNETNARRLVRKIIEEE